VLQQLGELGRKFQEQSPGRQIAILALPVVVVALLVLGALVVWTAAQTLVGPAPTVVVQAPPGGQATAKPGGGTSPAGAAASPNPAAPSGPAEPGTSPAPAGLPTVLVPSRPPASPTPIPSPTPSPEPTVPPARSARIINTEGQGANMRRTPSVSAQRVKVVPEGTIVELLGPDTRGDGYTWRNVRDADGASGYVIADYLQPIQTPAGATPVLPPPRIEIEEITSPVNRGDDAMLTITTRPGARCELRVQLYGPATLPREGLEVSHADADGHCSWTWKVPEDVVPGTWRYRIIVGEGESSSTREVPIVIT